MNGKGTAGAEPRPCCRLVSDEMRPEAGGGERMGGRGWRDLGAYALWQAPDTLLAGVALWLLVRWGALSPAWALGLFLVWLAKDIALYPLIRGTFRRSRVGAAALMDARGVVEVPLAPRGQVRLRGELWQAQPAVPGEAIPVGSAVRVTAVHGLTLFVAPEPEAARGRTA